MKILILSDINSAHTEKWVKGLCEKGVSVSLFSLTSPKVEWFSEIDNFQIGYAPKSDRKGSGMLSKLRYLGTLTKLKKCIKEIKPDIVHAHYATSYGLLGKLSGHRPFIISVWGSDVFEFPTKSAFNRVLLKKILRSTDLICSTSDVMAEEVRKYIQTDVRTIPFGINTIDFNCHLRTSIGDKREIVIGCVKTLAPSYGTHILIEAFHEVTLERQDLNLKLLLVGGGNHIDEYKQRVAQLGVSDKVEFTGFIPLNEIPNYHCKIDLFVSLSMNESFGVSLIEAMASGSHIVATKTPGFKEVLRDSDTYGLMVNVNSIEEAKNAILHVLDAPKEAALRSSKAKVLVQEQYEWEGNLSEMINVYLELMKTKKQ